MWWPGWPGGRRPGCRRAGGGRDYPAVLRLLVWTCYETANLVRDLGYSDLGIVAASALADAAGELGDPAGLGVAAFAKAHALAAVAASAFTAAVQVSTRAADDLAIGPGDEALAAAGSLHLAARFALAAPPRPEEAAE